MERRLRAIAVIWSCAVELAPQRVASEWMKVMKFEGAVKAAAENVQFREMLNIILAVPNPEAKLYRRADKARPFVSETTWALFAAFRATVSFAMLQATMLKNGLDEPKLLNVDGVATLLSLALPDKADFIDKQGMAAFPYLIDELERRLLAGLRKELDDAAIDKESMERAASITKAADELF